MKYIANGMLYMVYVLGVYDFEIDWIPYRLGVLFTGWEHWGSTYLFAIQNVQKFRCYSFYTNFKFTVIHFKPRIQLLI